MSEYSPDSVPSRLAHMTGRLNRRLVLATGGLSHGLLSALATIAKQGPVRLADLAQLETVSAPGITRIVAELENRGLVVRGGDPEDGRAFRIQVTDAGMAAVLRARAARSEVIAELLSDLSEQELATIEAALPALERVIGIP